MSVPSNPIPPVASLPDVAKVREIIKGDDPSTWDIAWQANLTPWDGGDIQPPLREIIESGGIDFPRKGRALVPGCGSGYDAIYIASKLNLETFGMDIAKTAIERAQKIAQSKVNASAVNVKFKLGDFFALKATSDEEKFDLVYDYTFFVAIPPTKRPEWAQQMASLIRPGGYLITLVFPINPPTELGPPFFVRVEHYEDVLGANFVKVADKVPETSVPTHVGIERIVVWKRS
ncbi:putative thiol methyltransferase 2 [Hypsizygus marmoreus]|uniref:Thiol methyltransferase 2 n=1 Tax=Hypsizygus marmoreus TaxID=39966 RepID=A0A369J4G9_HYPMA|nr:putative thiol methyltransferase 2 [Hypsizygus marmoreus]